jgi:hypothetical protein
MSSKKRHSKQDNRFKWHKKPVPLFSKIKSGSHRVWGWVVAMAVVIGLWAICRPILHVDPFREFDPATPFSERFKVSNDGNLAVYNVKFYCHTVNVVAALNQSFTDNQLDAQPSRIDTLTAPGSTTIYCPFEEAVANNGHYTQTQIAFRITFHHLMYPWGTQRCYQFLGVLDSDNRVQWIYLNNNCPTHIIDSSIK